MEVIGILKEVDKMGRVVIPKEYRERYGLDKQIELIATDEGVFIRNPKYVLVEKE